MSRVSEQRAERIQMLTESTVRENATADTYDAMAYTLEHAAPDTDDPAIRGLWLAEAARLRKNVEHHRGWASKWIRDRETLEAQYERTEPSLVGAPPTAAELRKFRDRGPIGAQHS